MEKCFTDAASYPSCNVKMVSFAQFTSSLLLNDTFERTRKSVLSENKGAATLPQEGGGGGREGGFEVFQRTLAIFSRIFDSRVFLKLLTVIWNLKQIMCHSPSLLFFLMKVHGLFLLEKMQNI